MPVYPDKKNGAPTGRWRVEIQKAGQRYRQRHDDMKTAKADEARVLELFRSTGSLGGSNVAERKDPRLPTIAFSIKEASGQLWEGKASERTAWAHMDVIAEILGRETLLDDVTTQSMDKVIRELLKGSESRKPVSDPTVNRYLSHFHTFLDWCKGRGHRTVPVSETVFAWRDEDEGRIRWITQDEERQLEILLPENCWRVVKVAIETGCRRGELLSVVLDQINGTKLHLWKTKTKTPRTVPMEASTVRMLKALVTSGTMPTESELRYQWEKAKEVMGLEADEDFVFHCTRHTCATRLVEAGVNLRVIQVFLGHKRIETTMRYSHVHDLTLEDALATRSAHQAQASERSRWGQGPSQTVGLQAA